MPNNFQVLAICVNGNYAYNWITASLHITDLKHLLKHKRSSKVVVQGLVFVAHPLYIHITSAKLYRQRKAFKVKKIKN
jgi:hypothetical protein